MVRIDPEVRNWLRENNLGEISDVIPVQGGSINQSFRLTTEFGTPYFLKQNIHGPKDMFFREREGLKALQRTNGPFTPFVIHVGKTFLLLEDMQPAAPCQNFWRIYGRQMGRLHRNIKPLFGYHIDNYIGRNPQYNNNHRSGFNFFRYRRIIPQTIWARDQSLIDSRDIKYLERFLYRLPELFPLQPPSLLHGDLWSGNLITDGDGMPVLVDPAVYYGWAEADLAMAELFGTYPEEFYRAYSEINSLVPGYRDRFPLYNLYHLLNHLNMFGRSYLPRIREILRDFSDG